MSALIVDVLRVAVLGLAVLFLWDVWQLVRKKSAALDRDQQTVEVPITRHHPELAETDCAEFDIDLDDDESTAVLKFIDAFRAAKEQYHRDQ